MVTQTDAMPKTGPRRRMPRWRRAWLRVAMAVVAATMTATTARSEITPPQLARLQDQPRFRVTTFATGLAYPTSMTRLADGSLLVATNAGGPSWIPSFIFSSPSAALVRLVDADGDGVADGQAQTLASGLPGLVSSVRRVGDLVVALSSGTGQKGITVLRTGPTAGSNLTTVGRLDFAIPASFSHTSYGMAARPAPGGGVEVYFNLGSEANDRSTPPTTTIGLSTTGGLSLENGPAAMAADSVYRVVLTDGGGSVAVSSPVQIARGLRNAAGLTFDAAGNLYLQDNGIDGGGHVSLSADELNRIAAGDVAAGVPDFGFAETYVDYATGATVGPTEGVTPPLVAFRPLDGEKSEGAVELAVAPASFPADFTGGLFVPFSGKFNLGGPLNDENPLVFVDPTTNAYFHFISNQLMGHPNGVLATEDELFLSDLNYRGAFGGMSPAGVPADQEGVIYRITYVPEPSGLLLTGIALGCIGWRRRKNRGREPISRQHRRSCCLPRYGNRLESPIF